MKERDKMDNKLFDNKIKELVESYSTTTNDIPDVWSGIQNGLGKKRRISVWLISSYSVAAALILAFGLFFFLKEDKLYSNSQYFSKNISIDQPTISVVPSSQKMKKLAFLPMCKQVEIIDKAAENIEDKVQENPAAKTPKKEEYKETLQEISKAQENILFEQEIEDTFIPERKRKPISISASSNMGFAANSSKNDNSGPMYVRGENYFPIGGNDLKINSSRHSLPITVGLNLRIPVINKFSISTGVNFSILNSRYDALVNSVQGSLDQSLYYIGVPVLFNYDVLSNDHFIFYTYLGGAIEKGLNADYTFRPIDGESSNINSKIKRVQWSAALGLGFEYRFLQFMGIYIDPSLAYYFNCQQPESIRTDQPLQLRVELGFRFHLFSY